MLAQRPPLPVIVLTEGMGVNLVALAKALLTPGSAKWSVRFCVVCTRCEMLG